MATPAKPFNPPFAKNGDREAVGVNSDDNSVNWNEGYTLPYEKPPQDGGKDIERKKMNEVLYQICDKVNNLSQEIDKWTQLTTQNLNDIKERENYYQHLSAQATTERNYPVNLAGYLIVFNNSINNWGVTQFYKVFNSDKIYVRRTTSATAWSSWDSITLTSELNTAKTQLQNSINTKEDKTKFTNALINSSTNTNLNNLTTNGFYWRTRSQGSPLPTTYGGAVIVDTNGSQVIQYFYTDIWNSATGGIWFRTRNTGGTWTDWHHLENSEYAEATYRKIADSYTKTQCDSTFLTKTLASSTYRTIADSYTKTQCDNTFLTKTLASSTYRTIADSYSKTETNTQINNAVNATTHRYKAIRCNPSANTIQWQTGGITISKQNDYTVRITHNLGTTNYAVTASINRIGRPLGASSANVVSVTANYCDISCHWGGDNSAGNVLPTIMNVSIFY